MAERNLENQIAVVTGASRGIGRAIAVKLGSLGATVVVNYSKSREQADEVVSLIRSNGGQAQSVGFDVGNAEAVEEGFKAINEQNGGRVDILVNNAGIAVDSLLVRTRPSDWQRTIDVNLSGCFYCARLAAKSMIKARTGRIVNISSVIGEIGNAGQAAYSASKAGIIGLTKSLARELASRAITVNAITPGYIDTEMTASMDQAMQEKLLEQIPLRKIGTADDVAEVVAFLASPGGSYITGHILAVNGGLHM